MFNESQVTQLIETFQYEVQQLEQSLVSYKQARDINVLHQEIVNATIRHDFYNGSEYTLVAFGFSLPATNEKNVLYRDMKLVVPFHLILRLMIRFQESQLLLPQESRQLLNSAQNPFLMEIVFETSLNGSHQSILEKT
ncbi:uncharacterized protein PHALS_09685 [Plasmopara halstedii]|uniref:Uncharacterized protein n=1 Tax=Plasmopara halstedii TaxID=4781 RepID=A0A0P1AF06_PLAHL|nr:uncharacterized protein PHALS_09685 [Plasmopara halstedii]CEG39438.1 hypothetical protein PHALS_09685 [Plasmopara halstedii]|eukprot:XP_024575807.1 hypothetical protein PHALS_09685 [Plasmopara halstedii]